MNILIFNWRDPKNPQSGGAEIVTQEHAKAWVRKGHSVIWFTSHFYGSKRYDFLDGIKIVRWGSARTVYFFAPIFYLRYRNAFDVVVDEIHGIPFFTPLFVKKPKIAFIHEVAGEIWDYMKPFPVNLLGKLIESVYFIFYRNIPFWTDAPSTINDLVARGIPRGHCKAIPCPIINTVISKLPRKEEHPTYIFVSRLVKMKGVEDVIEAFAIISKSAPNSTLWIVGLGEEHYVKKLRILVFQKNLNRSVVFWGRVSEERKLELMRKAHILLHASVKEGWGLVVLEAASQGTPAVVYNVAGLRDTVKNGKTGVVLTQNNPQTMAEQSLLFIKDNRHYRRYQKNCLEWVKSLTWKDATSESLKLLTQ